MKNILIPIFIFSAFIALSCNKSNPVGPSLSNKSNTAIKIGFSIKDAPADVASVVGILSRQGYDTLTSQFAISNDTAQCEFDNIVAGTWHLQVNAYDGTNALKYSGGKDVQVVGGEITAVNLVLNPTTGSINVTVTWGAAAAGNALKLDGATGYLEVPNSSSLSSPSTAITMEAWVKPADQYYNTVIAKGSMHYLLEFAEGLYPGIILTGVTLDPSAPNYWGRLMVNQNVPADQWTHIAVTYSQSTGVKVYYNGQLVYQGTGSGQISAGSLPLRIGARVDSIYTEYFKGEIDDVRIWNVVRSQSDISQNMSKELTGTEAGLVAYYKYDETAGSTVIHDATSHHNDGSLYGNATLVNSAAF